MANQVSALVSIKQPAIKAMVSASRVQRVVLRGGMPGKNVVEACKIAAKAANALTKLVDLLEPLKDNMPDDGSMFWVTGEGEDAHMHLVRIGVIPGKESWGKVLHTVNGETWLSSDFFCLWWPLDFFPVDDGGKGMCK